MDALIDAIQPGLPPAAHTAAATPATPPGDAGHPNTTADEPTHEPTDQPRTSGEPERADRPKELREPPPACSGDGQEREPQPEGEDQLRTPPAERPGPYPSVEILVTATLNQLATALTLPADRGPEPEHDPPAGVAGTPPPAPLGSPPGAPPGAPPGPAVPLLAVEGFARAQYGQPVPPPTLALLACSARLRRVLTDRHGAVLALGRTSRLATPAQRRALLARDRGCVIPGCPTPAGSCDIHHPTPWAGGGGTDLDNLALVCPRHHSEIHDATTGRDTWRIHMIDGVPWVQPPTWAHPTRPLLRNTTHQPTG
jgi:hypothetical protein